MVNVYPTFIRNSVCEEMYYCMNYFSRDALQVAIKTKNEEAFLYIWNMKEAARMKAGLKVGELILEAAGYDMWKSVQSLLPNLLTRKEPLSLHIGHRGQTILHEAARAGQTDIINSICPLVSDSELDRKVAGKRTPLWYAMAWQHFQCCQQLLIHGADPRTASLWLTKPIGEHSLEERPFVDTSQLQSCLISREDTVTNPHLHTRLPAGICPHLTLKPEPHPVIRSCRQQWAESKEVVPLPPMTFDTEMKTNFQPHQLSATEAFSCLDVTQRELIPRDTGPEPSGIDGIDTDVRPDDSKLPLAEVTKTTDAEVTQTQQECVIPSDTANDRRQPNDKRDQLPTSVYLWGELQEDPSDWFTETHVQFARGGFQIGTKSATQSDTITSVEPSDSEGPDKEPISTTSKTKPEMTTASGESPKNVTTEQQQERLEQILKVKAERQNLRRYYYSAWFAVGLKGTILHGACALGYTDVIKMVLKHRPDKLQKLDHKDRAASFYAIINGHLDALRHVHNKAGTMGRNPILACCIHLCMYEGLLPHMNLKHTPSLCFLQNRQTSRTKESYEASKVEIRKCIMEHGETVSFDAPVGPTVAARCVQVLSEGNDKKTLDVPDTEKELICYMCTQHNGKLIRQLLPFLPKQIMDSRQNTYCPLELILHSLKGKRNSPEKDEMEKLLLEHPIEVSGTRLLSLLLTAETCSFHHLSHSILTKLPKRWNSSDNDLVKYFATAFLCRAGKLEMDLTVYLNHLKLLPDKKDAYYLKQIALHVSVMFNHQRNVELLLRNGCKVLTRIDDGLINWAKKMELSVNQLRKGWSAVHTACTIKGDTVLSIVLSHAQSCESNISTIASELAYLCAAYGREKSYTLLTKELECSHDTLPETKIFGSIRFDTRSLLLTAAKNKHQSLAIMIFIQQGRAVVTSCTENETNIYHYCAMFGMTSLMLLLLDNGVTGCDVTDAHGCTPRYYAQMMGHVEILQGLFEKAGVGTKDTTHRQAGTYGTFTILERQTATMGEFGLFMNMQSHEIMLTFETPVLNTIAAHLIEGKDHLAWGLIQACRYSGVDILQYNNRQQSLLHLVTKSKCHKSLEILLEIVDSRKNCGTDPVEVRDIECRTPLMIAVETGNLECIRVLLPRAKTSLEPNVKSGENILHDAIKRGNPEVVKFIVENLYEKFQSLLYVKDHEGNTPLDFITLLWRRGKIYKNIPCLQHLLPVKEFAKMPAPDTEVSTSTRNMFEANPKKVSTHDRKPNGHENFAETTLLKKPTEEIKNAWSKIPPRPIDWQACLASEIQGLQNQVCTNSCIYNIKVLLNTMEIIHYY